MTQCNYCILQWFKKVKKGAEVITRPKPWEGFPDGVDVLIKYPDQPEPVWAAWFAALPNECRC